MLEIKVTLDKAAPAAYLQAHGISADLSGKLVMHAADGENTCGYGVASIHSGYAEIHEVCCEGDVDYLMGKALLNLIDNAGIGTVYCANRNIRPLLLRLGFQSDGNDGYKLDLKGYFTTHC